MILLTLAAALHVATMEPIEIVGTWHNQWGAVIELRSDYTQRSHFADEFGKGTWHFEKGAVLTVEWYVPSLNKASRGAFRIISFKKDTMRLQGPEGSEAWIRQKRKFRWPKELG
jgi:hypothetical protein